MTLLIILRRKSEMKVTKAHLKDIIQEEIQQVLNEGFFLPAAGAAAGVSLRSAIKTFLGHFLRWEIVSGAPAKNHVYMKEKRAAMRDLYKKLGIKTPEEKFQKYIDNQLRIIREEMLKAIDMNVERISKDLGVKSIGSAAGGLATRVTRKGGKK